jgi:V-type H+-transporting ATPase subunit E
MALTDADVRKQLSQMIKFIMQEANEKASEISVQAEEEFNIARQNILLEEKKKINKEFERKMKQVEVKKKMYVCYASCVADVLLGIEPPTHFDL